MVNRTIDYCKFFRDKRYEPVLQIFYKIFASKSDIANSCPIKKVSGRLGFCRANICLQFFILNTEIVLNEKHFTGR